MKIKLALIFFFLTKNQTDEGNEFLNIDGRQIRDVF